MENNTLDFESREHFTYIKKNSIYDVYCKRSELPNDAILTTFRKEKLIKLKEKTVNIFDKLNSLDVETVKDNPMLFHFAKFEIQKDFQYIIKEIINVLIENEESKNF